MVFDQQDITSSSRHNNDEVTSFRRHSGVTVLVRSRCNRPHAEKAENFYSSCTSLAIKTAYPLNYKRCRNALLEPANSSQVPENSSATKCVSPCDSKQKCLSYAGTVMTPSNKQLSSTCDLSLNDIIQLLTHRRSFTRQISNFLCLVLLLQIAAAAAAATLSKVPIIRTDATTQEFYHVFGDEEGSGENDELHFQLFKYLKEWERTSNVLLVGGRNYIYMFDPLSSANNGKFSYLERLQWVATDSQKTTCKQQLRSEYECQNYIRVVELKEDKTLHVCGTNAFLPRCRTYARSNFASSSNNDSLYTSEDSCAQACEVPKTPSASNVFLYANTSRGYRGIAALNEGFLGQESILIAKGLLAPTLITSMADWFRSARYIKIFRYKNGKTYLFYRDQATEAETQSTSTTVSRIAQICPDDVGGESILQNKWTSFLSARLKCSYSGDASQTEEFRFDNLTSVSDVVQMDINGEMVDVIFATFTTPESWKPISISAVCVYTMEDIINVFDNGQLAQVVNFDSAKLPDGGGAVRRSQVVPVQLIPERRPGQCLLPNQTLTNQDFNFISSHPSMYTPVTPHFSQPIYVSDFGIRMTALIVDVQAGGGNSHAVLYIGTEAGKLMRLRPDLNEVGLAMFLEDREISKDTECQKGEKPCSIYAFSLSRPSSGNGMGPVIIAAFSQKLVRVPLSFCDQYVHEECCNLDPECGWAEGECVARWSNSNLPPTLGTTKDLPEYCSADYMAPKRPTVKNIRTATATSVFVGLPEQRGKNDEEAVALSGSGVGGYVVAVLVGALIAEAITLAVIFVYRRRRKAKRRLAYATPSVELSTRQMDEDGSEVFVSQTKSRNPSKNTNQSGNQHVKNGPDKGQIEEMSAEIRRRSKPNEVGYSDSPLPYSGNEKIFLSEEVERKHTTGAEWIPLVKADSLDFPTPPIDLSPNFATADTLPLPNPSDNIVPPKLPPKQGSFTKAPAMEPQATKPFSEANSNNNNNAKTVTTQRPSALSSLLFPPPPPSYSDKEEDKSEVNSLISTPRSLTPTFKPPPPPVLKARVQKHETFSGPADQKKRPPVPPKSAAVVRSASMRTGPPIRGSSGGFGHSFSLDDQEILKARKKHLEMSSAASLHPNRHVRALPP